MCDPPISRGGKVIEQKFRDRPLVSSTSKERAEQLFRQQREGNKALTEMAATVIDIWMTTHMRANAD
jgi:hypothetical protein